MDDLSIRYFEWLYELVCNDKYHNRLSYRKLLKQLDSIEFTWLFDLDSNRAEDGIDFRYRFGYEFGYPREDIERYLVENKPCTVLEMMVALSFRVEEQIMDDPKYGNRTGQWFWSMIVSLGLGKMNDDNFDPVIVDEVIHTFLEREYEPNGMGGLFTINNTDADLRQIEIWIQCMWYLDNVIDGY